jgi:hypothetical protein
MGKIKLLVFLLMGCTVFAQKLHHQMIASQGTNTKLSNGMLVNQSVGQLSAIGNYSYSKGIVGQGFIQSMVSSSKTTPVKTAISAVVYPNPFTDVLNFRFSAPIEGNVQVTIFDIRGRLVYSKATTSISNVVTISELYFSEGTYFVKLEAKDVIYSSQIIKK